MLSKDAAGNTVESKAFNAHKTKVAKELIEIELENGAYVRCTVDHKFLLKDGTYKEAQDLLETDELAEI